MSLVAKQVIELLLLWKAKRAPSKDGKIGARAKAKQHLDQIAELDLGLGIADTEKVGRYDASTMLETLARLANKTKVGRSAFWPKVAALPLLINLFISEYTMAQTIRLNEFLRQATRFQENFHARRLSLVRLG